MGFDVGEPDQNSKDAVLSKMKETFPAPIVSHFQDCIELNDPNFKKVNFYTKNILSNQKLESEMLFAAHESKEGATQEQLEASKALMLDDKEWE